MRTYQLQHQITKVSNISIQVNNYKYNLMSNLALMLI